MNDDPHAGTADPQAQPTPTPEVNPEPRPAAQPDSPASPDDAATERPADSGAQAGSVAPAPASGEPSAADSGEVAPPTPASPAAGEQGTDLSEPAPVPTPPVVPPEFYEEPAPEGAVEPENPATPIESASAPPTPAPEATTAPFPPVEAPGASAATAQPTEPPAAPAEATAEPAPAWEQDAVPLPEDQRPDYVPPQATPSTWADLGAEPLEDLVLPPTAPAAGAVQPGSTLDWDGLRFSVGGALGDGWWTGTLENGQPITARPGGDGELWTGLPGHRALPRILHASKAGLAVLAEGDPVDGKLAPLEALRAVLPAAQLLRFLDSKGLAAVQLTRSSLRKLPDGRWTLLPPRLARAGEAAPPVYTPGYTPRDILNGGTASTTVGVALIGATLYHLVEGQPLPEEGADDAVLGAVAVPGWPQLLTDTLAEPRDRLTPAALLDRLRLMLAPEPPRLVATGFTTVGLNPTRPVNEDAFGYRLADATVYPAPLRTLQAVLSDGMGGMAAGEVASRAAVTAFLAEAVPPDLDADAQAEWTLARAWAANAAVLDALHGQNGGCTLTAVVAIGGRVTLAHVGDSRAYLWREGQLRQISKDHSWVALMVASGNMTPEEAAVSDQKNMILRSMGSERERREGYIDTLQPGFGTSTLDLQPGDLILLVSDGVWGEVEPGLLRELVEASATRPRDLVRELVQAALNSGAPDNATAVAVTVE